MSHTSDIRKPLATKVTSPNDPVDIGAPPTPAEVAERKRLAEETMIRERQFSQLVNEQELLISEIHHRVKNHLQTVVSLLSLQAESTSDPHVKQALSEAGGRVRAVSRLHERMYASPNFAEINFGDYLQHLGGELKLMHGRPEISLAIDAEDVVISMDSAMPLGLIANELILNSLKHAFPSGRSGGVSVAIGYLRDTVPAGVPLDEALLQLRVADDGIGLPPELQPQSADTLGFRIVQLLTKQLGGQVEFRSAFGLEVCVTFSPARV